MGLHWDVHLHLSSQTINQVISYIEIKPHPRDRSLLPPMQPARDETPGEKEVKGSAQPQLKTKQMKVPTLSLFRGETIPSLPEHHYMNERLQGWGRAKTRT